MTKWVVYSKKADFKEMGRIHGIDQVLARILVNRGLTEETQVRSFLHPSYAALEDGSKMKDMAKAVSLLRRAMENGTHIRIIGDYDIDGVQATYILHQGLLRCHKNVSYGIPHRVEDGYGLNVELIDSCIADGVGLVITCDNGIAAADAIRHAKDAGITVIVTDHHEVPYEMRGDKKIFHLPPADAIVNPKQENCAYPCKKLCGAAVAWKVIQALYREVGIPEEEADIFLENAAFATIGDVMELVEENRSIVALGLAQLRQTKNLGMQTLIEKCGLAGKELNAYHVGFVLGPCINASGRLASATKALELLEAQNMDDAVRLADELKVLNEERKVMTEEGKLAAFEYVESSINLERTVLVIYLPGVHESVAGIIAGRVRERYERPTFVLVDAADGDELKGSGRSVEGYSMYDEMCKCKELFTKFGGHPMAAGLSLPKKNLEAFREAINDNCEVDAAALQRVVRIDVPMPFSYLKEELIEQLALLEPFGNGNPKPVFAQKNVSIFDIKAIGKQKNALKMTVVGEDNMPVEALYFGDREQFEMLLEEKQKISLTYYPQISSFRNRCSIQIVITDFC